MSLSHCRSRVAPAHASARVPFVLAAAIAVLIPHQVEPVRAQQPSMEQLRDAAGNYVRAAFPRLANLVATEEYFQRLSGSPGNSLTRRQRTLTSEILLVQH